MMSYTTALIIDAIIILLWLIMGVIEIFISKTQSKLLIVLMWITLLLSLAMNAGYHYTLGGILHG